MSYILTFVLLRLDLFLLVLVLLILIFSFLDKHLMATYVQFLENCLPTCDRLAQAVHEVRLKFLVRICYNRRRLLNSSTIS